MKSSMKGSSRPPIPPEMPYLTKEGTLEKRCDWNALVRKYSQRLVKILRKNRGEGDMDTSDAMLKRRTQVLVDYTPKIIERYRDVPGYEPENRDDTGETFIHFNFIPVTTYNYMEDRAYLLLAASIWILDEILPEADHEKRKELFRLLPRDESDLDEIWNAPDFWHTNYEDDLITSVQYVLHCRNRDIDGIELEHNETERLFTSSLIAQDAQHVDVPSRAAYEQMMSLIPKESIDRAVAYFEELFWLWTDRFFDCVAPLDAAIRQATDKVNDLVTEYNRLRSELKEATKEMIEQRETKKQQIKPPAFNPLLANPVPQMPDIFKKQDFASSLGSFAMNPLRGSDQGDPSQRVFSITDRMMNTADRHDDAMNELSELEGKKADFAVDLLRQGYLRDHECREKYGDEVADRMKPLNITKPFEVCFALLWLIENGSDLPWLYGCGCGLMEEVVESLPWGVFHYSEIHDPVWNPEDEEEAEQLSFLDDAPRKEKTVKPSAIPEWYERKYKPDEDESFRFNRSMAQIVYEETGCILPRDMHKYDIRQKAVKQYGVTGKDTTALLMLFTALGNAKRSERALNLDQALMEYWDDEASDEEKLRKVEKAAKEAQKEEKPPTYEELVEKLKAEQEKSKNLRTSLHEAEKASRETRKELAAVRESAALEHRELADLREIVFNAENNETEDAEEPLAADLFPYEVKKETVVFGGHETWLKAIKPMLTGQIRFLDKDLNFDVNVIRNADIVWVQTNAISHTQYYKITDAARQYKKPVRYFSHASATKGALQIMDADRGGEKLV
ncbi:MAG: hypothetical protein IJK38_04470 [Oscillospiraceae bacterium]|nr:hypothetical protein [Oscillospiraceae bacterium]MBR0391555.1 hypothetical protein [Oscillospiraceae bacterium]